MVQNSALCNKLRDACSHVFQGSTIDLELARFMLSAQHEELCTYQCIPPPTLLLAKGGDLISF